MIVYPNNNVALFDTLPESLENFADLQKAIEVLCQWAHQCTAHIAPV